MSFLLKRFRPKQVFHVYKALSTTPVRQAYYFPDFKAGPYPRTKEEREAAAKKYNLLYEEYQPYSEPELQIGDYPELPFESVHSKDPFYSWDYAELRKNYNEPVPFEIMILQAEGISTVKTEYSLQEELFFFFTIVSGALLILYILDQFIVLRPIAEKQYPAPGVTHYTFEFISEEEFQERKKQDCMKKCLEIGQKS